MEDTIETCPKPYSWMNPKLAVESTDKYGGMQRRSETGETFEYVGGFGRGVFARQKVRKDEVLFVMGGYILTIADEDALEDGLSDKPIELSVDFSIGPRSPLDLPRMPQHYVNHSCDPNSGFDGQIIIVAMRDIEVDEEITYDYAMIMISNENSKSYFSFDCKCGSDLCRRIIRESDWQIGDLQRRYQGYFSHAVAKLIAANTRELNEI
ncbi:MAG: SET domain-containing protein, partial [Burkholderiaceae bacterium]|nr:SET domain-containing protein [Burkholderiaceae bacterium]